MAGTIELSHAMAADSRIDWEYYCFTLMIIMHSMTCCSTLPSTRVGSLARSGFRLGYSIKVEYHANAKYQNPHQNSEKNDMYLSKVNVFNNGKKIISHHARFLFKCHLVFRYLQS